jgi:hypothetical protein
MRHYIHMAVDAACKFAFNALHRVVLMLERAGADRAALAVFGLQFWIMRLDARVMVWAGEDMG